MDLYNRWLADLRVEIEPGPYLLLVRHSSSGDTLLASALVTLRVRFERIPRAAIPEGRDARAVWLLEDWRRVDAWVSAARARRWRG